MTKPKRTMLTDLYIALDRQCWFNEKGEYKTSQVAFKLLADFVIGSMCLIWSINTLFNLGIPHNIYTYMAAFILMGRFGQSSNQLELVYGVWRKDLLEKK